MFNFINLQSSITHKHLTNDFECFKEVLNAFIVCFNCVILLIFTTEEFKTCIKHVEKACSDVDALWNFVNRHSSVQHNQIKYL